MKDNTTSNFQHKPCTYSYNYSLEKGKNIYSVTYSLSKAALLKNGYNSQQSNG